MVNLHSVVKERYSQYRRMYPFLRLSYTMINLAQKYLSYPTAFNRDCFVQYLTEEGPQFKSQAMDNGIKKHQIMEAVGPPVHIQDQMIQPENMKIEPKFELNLEVQAYPVILVAKFDVLGIPLIVDYKFGTTSLSKYTDQGLFYGFVFNKIQSKLLGDSLSGLTKTGTISIMCNQAVFLQYNDQFELLSEKYVEIPNHKDPSNPAYKMIAMVFEALEQLILDFGIEEYREQLKYRENGYGR